MPSLSPDFTQKTVEIVAKRAAFKCSNPDCTVTTVGPNQNVQQSTLIGEAAHIYGARPLSKRYRSDMTDTARSEITNAIWLCRNCHKLIDSDEQRYTSNILFAWREQHEKDVLAELGNRSNKTYLEEQAAELAIFESYPPIIRRIVIDKPEGWEWRLTAELMRHLNRPILRRLRDLQEGLYTGYLDQISDDDVIDWVDEHLNEASSLIQPLEGLFKKLTESWGVSSQEGDIEEIHHIAILIRDSLERIIEFEEGVYFTKAPVKYQKLVDLFKDILGSQADKLANIPDKLDELVNMIGTNHSGTHDAPFIFNIVISFELPKGWDKRLNRELKKARKLQSESGLLNGVSLIIIIIVVFWIILMFF